MLTTLRRLVELVPLLAALAVSLACASCRHVQPWERSRLAHPSMTTAAQPGPAEEHAYSVHEGAAGGSGSVQSGCGCN
jgi:hypothetical protein